MSLTDPALVTTFPDLTRAHLAKGVLESAGIESELRHLSLGGVLEAPPSGPIELWCERGQLERARTELARGEEPAAPPKAQAKGKTTLVISALLFLAVAGWARVYQLSRPSAVAGSWDARGHCYTEQLGSMTREFCDTDHNGIWERGNVHFKGSLVSQWTDADENGLPETEVAFDSAGVRVREDLDVDRDGMFDTARAFAGDGTVTESVRDPSGRRSSAGRRLARDGAVLAVWFDEDHDGLAERAVDSLPSGATLESIDRDHDGVLEVREMTNDGGVLFRDRFDSNGRREDLVVR